MSTLLIPPGKSFEIINATSIRYNGLVYLDVTNIHQLDGTDTTPGAILQSAGGVTYSSNELKRCVKVEGYDPDHENRQIFTCYSTNSRQTGKNVTDSVPGGMWIEMFNFQGNLTDAGPYNGLFTLWKTAPPVAGIDYLTTWLGFKMNYGTVETRTYLLTQVNDFGEESIPCPPASIDVSFMHGVELSGKFKSPAPLASAFYVPIAYFNVYRSNVTASGQAVYQVVPKTIETATVTGNTASVEPNKISLITAYFPFPVRSTPNPYTDLFGWKFTDNARATDLLETLPSLDWDPPPARKLMGLTAWRNGMMVAFDNNLIYFCEPFRPSAWPQKYIIAIPFKILALTVDENALLVITDREPYVITGSHPSNATYEKLQNVEAGLATAPNAGGFTNPSRAVVRSPAGVIYGTHDGLWLIASGRARPLGRALFTREEWDLRYKAFFTAMRLAYSDGHLICYFSNGATGFLINVVDPDTQMTELILTATTVSDFILPHDDSLYVVTSGITGSTIARFGDETMFRVQFGYSTRDVIVPQPVNFGALQIVGYGDPAIQSAPLLVQVFGDGVLRFQLSMIFPATGLSAANSQAYSFRLPNGFKARRWRLRFGSGADQVVREAYLASTMSELATV
jgi:hypothetical protein